jgi:protein involved in polysaccharide export with SLBB domain
MSRFLCAVCWLALAVLLAGCGANHPINKPSPAEGVNGFREDPLRIGDRVRVEFSGTADTLEASEQDIHEDGSINLRLIGRVVAAGKSPSQLEKEITGKYEPDYYPHITITVTPLARYFFVGGQIMGGGGGRILYTGPITVLGAIQAAGDFNPFANRRKVQITRADGKSILYVNCLKAIKHPELDLPIYPGDRIFVSRRF